MVNSQAHAGCSASLAPRALAPHQGAELTPRWVEVGVRHALFPLALGLPLMQTAAVALLGQRAAVKAGPRKGHALGNSGSGRC